MILGTKTRCLWLIGLLLFALLMRVWNYHTLSLSNDELSAWNRLNANSISELWEKGVKPDGHPALVQTTLYYWFKLFPDTPWSFRLLFILAGTLSVWIFFRIAFRMAGEGTAWLGAVCMTALQYFIIYSQLARPYAFGLLFTLMAYDGWSLYFYQQNKIRHLIYFSISGLLAMYSHYFSFLMVLIFSLTGIFLLNKQRLYHYLLAGLAMSLSFMPHLSITLYQLSIGGVGGEDGWLGPPSYSFLTDYLFYAANNSWIVVLCVLIISFVTWVRSLNKPLQTYDKKLIATWFLFWILPIAVGFYYSRWRNPVLQYSVVIFSFPFLLLVLFYAAKKLSSMQARLTGLILLLVIAGSTIIEKKYYQRTHWAEFKDLAVHIHEWKQQFGQDIYILVAANLPGYLGYYLNRFDPPVQADEYLQNISSDWAVLRKKWNSLPHTYIALCWSNQYTPPEWTEFIRESHPVLLHRKYYFNSETWLFGKTGNGISEPAPISSYVLNAQTGSFEKTSAIQADSVSTFNFSTEFSPSIEIPAQHVIKRTTDLMWLSATVKLSESTCNPHLVFSIIDKQGNTVFWRSSEKKHQLEGTTGTIWLAQRMTMKELDRKNHLIKCYLWNPDGCKISVKKFTVETKPGNPVIYGYP